MQQLTRRNIQTYHRAIARLMAIIARSPKKEYMQDPSACEIYLTRTRWFLDLIGNPQDRIPHYVHITGTSGKGSTAAMMHGILRASGARVGSTFSPHPTTFTERIRVNEQFISVPEFIRLASRLEKYLHITQKKSPHGMISFFEFMHCFTLLYFVQKKVDWAVVEVGCGGRYCATNTIPTPDVTIITNVGLDHMQILGKTKTKIAWEKAGIIKEGTTLITAEKDPRLLQVFARQCARARPKKIIHASSPRIQSTDLTGTRLLYKKHVYTLPIIGAHQASNAALAIDAARVIGLDTDTIAKGLATITRPVCLEIMSQQPLIILDGAHNVDKMRTTRDALRTILRTYPRTKKPRVHLLIAMAQDKQHAAILRLIAPLASAITTTTFQPTEHKQAQKAEELATLVQQFNPRAQIEARPHARAALRHILRTLPPTDILLISGSIYLAGEVRQHWIPEAYVLGARSSTP